MCGLHALATGAVMMISFEMEHAVGGCPSTRRETAACVGSLGGRSVSALSARRAPPPAPARGCSAGPYRPCCVCGGGGGAADTRGGWSRMYCRAHPHALVYTVAHAPIA